MRRSSLALVSLFLLCGPLAADSRRPRADLVLHNGKVFTADAQRPWAEAVAVRGSRILAVGDDAPVRALEGPDTVSVDLGGRVVVPGFNDAHAHLGVGLPRLTLPPIDIPGPGPSLDAALDQVAGAVAVAEPGEWILVTIGELALFDAAADRQALDAVAPDNPTVLLTWSSHSAVINSAAIAAAGLAEDEPDPFGGRYDRFAGTDVLNGVLHEYALFRLFRTVRAEVPDEVLRAQYEALSELAARVGVTTIQEMTVGLPLERSARVLAGADVRTRLRLICVPLALDEPCRARRLRPSGRVTASGIKWLLDGTPVERSAALREPYADFPGSGHVSFTEEELSRIVRRSRSGPPEGNHLLVHAVGDRTLDQALAALDHAAPAAVWRRRRPRIEHGDLLHPEQIDLAGRLGVTVVQNPTHLALDLVPALGPDRAAAAQPLKTLLGSGVALAFGSDGVVPNPFVDLFFAVLHPFHPGEALTVEEAVVAYTRGSARAEHQERRKGTLRRGYVADLAVLSQDVFTVPPPAIPETVSLLTVVGGEVVWDAGELTPSP